MSTGRIGTSARQGLWVLLIALVLGGVAAGGAGARGSQQAEQGTRAAGVCENEGAIPAGALAGGLAAGCSLTGRRVVSGDVEVRVPPPGITVAADGIGRRGESRSLMVSNRGGVVFSGAEAASGAGAGAASRGPADCRSSQFALESGAHPWSTTIRWKLRNASVPKRMNVSTVAGRLKSAFSAWRTDRNDCGLGGQPKRLRETYAGWTKTATGIGVHNGTLTCGAFNRTNTVELGSLPGQLLGWTCYWWGNGGSMIAFDTRLQSSADMVIHLPKGCRNRWDLQSVATHEFGHAIGLGHVSNASQTMHGVAPACSTAPRTLGRGDRLGLQRLYGLS